MTKGQTKLLPIKGLPNGRGSASSRWFPANFSGCGFRDFSPRRSFGSKPPRCGSDADGVSAGGLPRVRYSDEREGAFSGPVRSRFFGGS